MDISYCSSNLLRHHVQSWLICCFYCYSLSSCYSLWLYPLLSLGALKSHNGPIQWPEIMQAVCVCVYVCAQADECVCRLSVLVHCLCRALSRTQRGMWWWKWMGIVESYLLCGDTASLRGLCHDATAEHGQPEGTDRLENTYCICSLVLCRKRGRERLKFIRITLRHALLTSTELVKLMLESLIDSYSHTNIPWGDCCCCLSTSWVSYGHSSLFWTRTAHLDSCVMWPITILGGGSKILKGHS